MKIYLSGPMDEVTSKVKNSWREYVKSQLTTVNFLDPTRRVCGVDCHENDVVDLDLLDVYRSDLVLVNFPSGDYHSYGTPMEMVYSYKKDIPTILVHCKPVWKISPWLRYHSNQIFNDLDHAINYIRSEYEV